MTNEEALELLNEHTQYYIPTSGSDLSALSLAIKAVEKQIPKKPYFERNMFGGKFDYCPKCKADISYEQTYCHECGQAILWEDTE